MKLTFIGNGNMAKALIKGMVQHYEIEVLGRNQSTLSALQAELPQITTRVMDETENMNGKQVILAVKPYSLSELAPRLTGEADALYSVLAGTSLESLRAHLRAKHFIRTMPNLGAGHLKSMTTLTGDEALKEQAIEIFDSVGRTLWLGTENEIDIATGVAGSGPAFLALIAEALADGAVKEGLKRTDSQVLVQGLFEGFAALLAEENPANIKDGVMSPGGTTAAGYAAMEQCNVRNGMMEAVKAAYAKAKELKEKN